MIEILLVVGVIAALAVFHVKFSGENPAAAGYGGYPPPVHQSQQHHGHGPPYDVPMPREPHPSELRRVPEATRSIMPEIKHQSSMKVEPTRKGGVKYTYKYGHYMVGTEVPPHYHEPIQGDPREPFYGDGSGSGGGSGWGGSSRASSSRASSSRASSSRASGSEWGGESQRMLPGAGSVAGSVRSGMSRSSSRSGASTIRSGSHHPGGSRAGSRASGMSSRASGMGSQHGGW